MIKDERDVLEVHWSGGTPLCEKFQKCANPACPVLFHYVGGGRVFGFRREQDAAPSNENQPDGKFPTEHHGVKHYWLCERCSHQFMLVHEQDHGVVLKPRQSDSGRPE
jgi:hypothetical protein